MYFPEHMLAWRRIVEFVHQRSRAKICMQLGHAGRKGSCSLPWEGDRPLTDESAWRCLGPSALPFGADWPVPKEMDEEDMARVRDEYVRATRMAEGAGFDMLELHAAHGYLLSSFISPLSNHRRDQYGGSLENRLRFPLEVFDAIRSAWPQRAPISVRISATDWLGPDGLTGDDAVLVARAFKEHGCDLIDVSTGGNVPESRPEYGRMYQVPFADQIRHQADVAVMAVGGILGADHANTIVGAGRADLCALARQHLKDPYLTLHAAETYGYEGQEWPNPYLTVKPNK
jgi:anthraniloyl-CoA monooxygenase